MDRYHNKLEYITFPESITDTLSFETNEKIKKKKKKLMMGIQKTQN